MTSLRSTDIPFDGIIKTLKLMTSKLPVPEQHLIHASWDRLRDGLDRTRRRRSALGKMDIEAFPRQQVPELPSDSLMEVL